MNKMVVTSYTILCLLSTVFLIGLKVNVKGSPELPVHNIDTELDYETIQEAIIAPETLDGHVILVDEGIYIEHLVLNKSLSLVGSNRTTTIIDGNHTGDVVTITASTVNITGFTIQNSGLYRYGILLDSSSGNTIAGNNIYEVGNAINLQHSNNNLITRNNVFPERHTGIYIWESNHNTFTSNTIFDSFQGIWQWNSTHNIFAHNNITSNSFGIYLKHSDYNTITRNIVHDNSAYGITAAHCNNNVLFGNTISNNRFGLTFWYFKNETGNNKIYHNNFVDNEEQAAVILDLIVNITQTQNQGPTSEYIEQVYFNAWDDGYPSGGNYWNDYNGTDTHEIGIGDTPYLIALHLYNLDRYPLMGPISIFDVYWNGAPYTVDVLSDSFISVLQLNVTEKTIGFNVNGSGVCRLTTSSTIVQDLWQGNYTVVLNGEPWSFESFDYASKTYMYFSYEHSNDVVIIPEFPSFFILPLFVMVILVAVIICRRKHTE